MGIDQPFVNGVLRQTEEGRCVFLDETHLCRIHAQYGADAKPLICRQYPIVGVRTETGERQGSARLFCLSDPERGASIPGRSLCVGTFRVSRAVRPNGTGIALRGDVARPNHRRCTCPARG